MKRLSCAKGRIAPVKSGVERVRENVPRVRIRGDLDEFRELRRRAVEHRLLPVVACDPGAGR